MALDLATIGLGMETSGLEKGQAALKQTEQAANRTADAADKLTGRMTATDRAMKSVSDATGLMTRAMAGYLSLQTVQQVIKIADAATMLDSRLKLVTSSTR